MKNICFSNTGKTDMICIVFVRGFELPRGFVVQESLAHSYVLSAHAVEYVKNRMQFVIVFSEFTVFFFSVSL
jgi:hypothetical protein